MNELLYPKELAAALRRSRTYVFAMKRAGFPMPGGTATLQEARDWLRTHPGFKVTDSYGEAAEGGHRKTYGNVRGIRGA